MDRYNAKNNSRGAAGDGNGDRREPFSGARLLLVLLLSSLLAACGGGGADTQKLPNTSSDGAKSSYTGPPPATDDVQAFRINLWENLKGTNRCGSCHNAGGQTPTFVEQDDINKAYSAANTVVDLSDPAQSRMVAKVGGGHNCWLDSNQACADVIKAYISAWAGGSTGATSQVVLTAPVSRDPGDSKTFPADASLFDSTVRPILQAHCAACHSESASAPEAPYFASSDLSAAYAAVKDKINLDDPSASRLVVRLRSEFHNCWSDCASNADTMQTAIQQFVDGIPATHVDPALVTSKALALGDGIVSGGGGRYVGNLIAFYQFKAGTGTTAYDTSGVEPALNLTLSGGATFVPGWGINVTTGKAQGSTTASKKLSDLIQATGEYSVEAWVAPANVTQEGPARIVSYSAGTTARNFTLGQTQYNYDFLNRSSVTDGNGAPAFSTADGDEVLQATLQHVVITFDPTHGRRIYVNGELVADSDPEGGGTLADWNNTYALVLGNEVSGDRQWQGVIRLVAIYNRALTQSQIAQNFGAGVGQKFYLLFGVSDLVNVPQSYVMFEVSLFDSYSYLFDKPTFISLDSSATPDGIPIQGIRLGINGHEASVGQAYANLDTTVTSSQYSAGSGQLLSRLGTTIGVEKGVDSDQFFLTFNRIGSNTHVSTEPAPPTPATPADLPASPTIGVRTFDEINATMSSLTGVPTSQSDVTTTFTNIKQQLPASPNIMGFLSSQQVAISQLAIEYCNALVDDTSLRASYFPGFDFTAAAGTAFDSTAKRDLVLDPLLDKMMGTSLSTQPNRSSVKTELNNLIDGLTACGGSCAAGRTDTVVKATCSALLGTAATTLQ